MNVSWLTAFPALRFPILACVLFSGGGIARSGLAEDTSSERHDAKEAFRSIGRQTWYDRESDTFSPPKVRSVADNPIRTEGRIAEKANERKKMRAESAEGQQNRWNWNWGNAIDPNLFSSLVIAALAIVLIVVIGLLTYHSVRQFLPGRWQPLKQSSAIAIDPAKVADLPFQVQSASSQDPLAEARRSMQAGDYSHAIVYLYGYMLLALDQSRLIELQRGKTNRMYLRELPQSDLRALVEGTMSAFEEVYFGGHRISPGEFMTYWKRLEQFHQQIAQTARGVAAEPEVATA